METERLASGLGDLGRSKRQRADCRIKKSGRTRSLGRFYFQSFGDSLLGRLDNAPEFFRNITDR